MHQEAAFSPRLPILLPFFPAPDFLPTNIKEKPPDDEILVTRNHLQLENTRSPDPLHSYIPQIFHRTEKQQK
jgi:hypothetical protein